MRHPAPVAVCRACLPVCIAVCPVPPRREGQRTSAGKCSVAEGAESAEQISSEHMLVCVAAVAAAYAVLQA